MSKEKKEEKKEEKEVVKKKKKKGFKISRGVLLFIILILSYATMMRAYADAENRDYTYAEFEQAVAEERIASITIKQSKEVPTGDIHINFADSSNKKILTVSDVNQVIQLISEEEFYYYVEPISNNDWMWWAFGIVSVIVVGVCCIVFMFNKQMNAPSSKLGNFNKSKAKRIQGEDMTVKFDDVAGLKEEKAELDEIVDFLIDPFRFTHAGARIPKGILLVGPPGTGKTLLARAVAGEARVPYFTISGSDFVEMFVGVGAARVRELFAEAKAHAPCIIFIDEIDAVARRRGSGMGGGHDEREQTLNQMLVEMDGFGPNEGVIVMAATNRVDILDPAILRPGRFDRKIGVGSPDVGARKEILEVHIKNKNLGSDVDLDDVAKATVGFSGADLENLMNESAIRAASKNRLYIKKEDIDASFIKIGIGTERRSAIVPEEERKITAYHEAGHAILFHLLPRVGPVHTVSIIPTGRGAAGYTMPVPQDDHVFSTKKKLLEDITVALGGRIAEDLVLDDITTGASRDIMQATGLAKAMVTEYGMSEKAGTICYQDGQDDIYSGGNNTRSYGENTAKVLDEEIKAIVDGCYERAEKLLKENIHILHACAELLLEKERITRQEFEALFDVKSEE